MKKLVFIFFLAFSSFPIQAWAFDHSHSQWDHLLAKHVRWIRSGTASEADYTGFKADGASLKVYLDKLSAVPRREFDGWVKEQQLAFLINAYNAFTVELILTKYPDVASIKDIGSLFSSPWKKNFFTFLGERQNLDWIEHEMIRKPGIYDDPRIHAAVNCASVGCPALRNEAFIADKLDAQLEDNMYRFLKDKARNRYNPKTGRIEVSRIFDWYREDFQKGYRGIKSLKSFFARYADLLSETPEGREKVGKSQAEITFLDYDWNLNDLSR